MKSHRNDINHGLAIIVFLISFPLMAQNMLSDTEAAQGFELLFDGTTASLAENWTIYVQGEDGDSGLDNWTVNEDSGFFFENGAIDLRSKKKYGNAEWRFEYRESGNSGIYYRLLTSGPAIWSTTQEFTLENDTVKCLSNENEIERSRYCPASSYTLYLATGDFNYKPWDTGEWNSVRIILRNDTVEHWHNDEKMLEYIFNTEEFFALAGAAVWGDSPIFSQEIPGERTKDNWIKEGYIGIQGDHAGITQIRNARIAPWPLLEIPDTSLGAGTFFELAGGIRITPGSGSINIHGLLNELRVYNLKGELFLPEKAGPSTYSIKGLGEGIYFVRLKTQTDSHTRRVLVKPRY